VIVLDPIRPSALPGVSMPLEVTVRHRGGRLVGNYSLSHVNDPLVLLVKPATYRVVVSAGCRGIAAVPPRGALTTGNEAHVLVRSTPTAGAKSANRRLPAAHPGKSRNQACSDAEAG
jgi:hypothetical protein